MDVEHVQLVISHQVDVAFDIANTEEMTGYIQHGASPRKSGIVSNRPGGHCPWNGLQRRTFDRRRQKLTNRLDAPEQACRFVSHKSDEVGCHGKLVALVTQRGITSCRG